MASLFQPASAVERRLKVLAYGPPGTGKTIFGLSFREAGRVAVIDTEGGTVLYGGKYPFDVIRTKDFARIMAAIEEMKRDGGKTFQTLMIDPITALWEILQQAGQQLAESRATRANAPGGVADVVLSQRDWGIIKRQYARLMTELVNLPMNVVITAWQKDLTDKDGNKIGVAPDGEKRTGYSPDIILRFTGGKDYTAVVEKDRSGLYPLGTKLSGPTYASFARAISHGSAMLLPDDDAAATSTAQLLAPEMAQPTPTETAPAPRATQPTAQPAAAPARPAMPTPQVRATAGNVQTGADALATEKQLETITKLSTALKRPVHDAASLTFAAARELITQLSQAYNEMKQGVAS
jgi:hypothetical protein